MKKDNNKINYLMRRLIGFIALYFAIKLCFDIFGWELFLINFLFWFVHNVFYHVNIEKEIKKRQQKKLKNKGEVIH